MDLPPRETMLDIFTKMSLLKQNDERMRAVIKSGRLVMPYYSVRGQEAIPSAISTLLRDTDFICTIYRGTHDSLAKGCPVDKLWAELAGRATGTCKGKGGPMHITHPESGVMVTTGIVGSTMPIANGLAWGSKLKGNDAVTVAYFGDGASNIGAFHESLNLASVWKLPVVFVCSNNGYAEHTKTEDCTAIDEIAKRADSYTMPGVRVNGNHPLEMYEAAKTAIERARSGGGPTLIEAMTFRFFGHVFGDADKLHGQGVRNRSAAGRRSRIPASAAKLIADGHGKRTGPARQDRDRPCRREMSRRRWQFALASALPGSDRGTSQRRIRTCAA